MLGDGGFGRVTGRSLEVEMNRWAGEEKEPLKKRKWPVGVQSRWGQMCPDGEEDSESVSAG